MDDMIESLQEHIDKIGTVVMEENLSLVVLSELKTFWLEPILSFLKENNVVIRKLELERQFINLEFITSKYVLIQAEEYKDINAGILKKLCELCSSKDLKLIVYGTADGISRVKKNIPESIVALVLERPGDSKLTGKKILNLLLGKEEETVVKNKRVLAIDDAGFMLRTIKSWLEDDYDVALANSASKAMTMLADPMPDLILLDYEMPICSGAQFFAMLQAEEKTAKIPVIFLTSKGDRETVTEVLNLRPAGYVLKTTTKEQLVSKIQEVLEKNEENNEC